jgi:hypothetical protein
MNYVYIRDAALMLDFILDKILRALMWKRPKNLDDDDDDDVDDGGDNDDDNDADDNA